MTQVHDHVVRLHDESPFRHIDVTKVGGVIGAVVGGIRVGADLSADAVAELRGALLAHRVVLSLIHI